jgi:hypothetical protein
MHPNRRQLPVRSIFCSFLVFLFSLAGTHSARASHFQEASSLAAGRGLPFAIADLDGDRRPDLARIQAAAGDSAQTNYRIELRLTAAGSESIQVVAPVGGIQIDARDVNGDHAVDLVLTTAWFSKPVAVFLNNGHGQFSRANPSAFPAAFSRAGQTWGSTSILGMEAAGVPPQSRDRACLENNGLPCSSSVSSSGPLPRFAFLCSWSLVSQPGRAPPTENPRF